MANFLEELWSSIFTPGPTPTLLIATNAAFAALQALLLGLLFATYSAHFVVLSFLCAGLWLSINWFAKEVVAFQESDEYRRMSAEQANDQTKGRSHTTHTTGDGEGDDDPSSDATEHSHNISSSPTTSPRSKAQRTGGNTSASEGLAPAVQLRQRRSLGESTGDLSTDSEWEKIEDE